MRKRLAFSLSTLLWAAIAAHAQPVVSDQSFETPGVGACPASELTPPGTAWVFGASAGITTAGCGQRFDAPKAPDGGQVGFIQVYTISPAGYVTSMSQTVAGFQAGRSYAISFYSAGRPPNAGCNDGCKGLNFSVLIGSTDVLDVVNPPSNAFQQYTTSPFTALGSVTISFSGSAPVGTDATSFIDLVSISDLGPAIPSIGGVVSASAFGEFATAAPGAWIEIYGSNLAVDTRGWTGADFTGINAPTSLDGTSVTVGGKSAFVDFISSGQVNALIPSDAPLGLQQIVVSNAGMSAAPFSMTINPVAAGLLAPPNFNVGGIQYVVAQFADGSYVLPAGAVSGLTSRPAKPGDIIVIYGVGFGPVTPDIPAGQLVGEANTLADSFQLSIGGVQCHLDYDGLAPNYTGLYQFNITVPDVASGNQPLTFTVDGVNSTQTLYVAVGN